MPLVENRLLFLFLRYGQAVLRLFSLSLSVFGNAKLRRMLFHRRKTSFLFVLYYCNAATPLSALAAA